MGELKFKTYHIKYSNLPDFVEEIEWEDDLKAPNELVAATNAINHLMERKGLTLEQIQDVDVTITWDEDEAVPDNPLR